MGLFKEGTIDKHIQDLAWEHPQHTELMSDKCSLCFVQEKELKGVEAKNEAEDNNLDILRARIQERREQREKEKLEVVQLAEEIKRTLLSVPEVTDESKAEFNLLRHTQLCQKVDVLYHNYLVSLDKLIENPTDEESNKIFQEAIKELSVVYDDLLFEGIKPRFS